MAKKHQKPHTKNAPTRSRNMRGPPSEINATMHKKQSCFNTSPEQFKVLQKTIMQVLLQTEFRMHTQCFHLSNCLPSAKSTVLIKSNTRHEL